MKSLSWTAVHTAAILTFLPSVRAADPISLERVSDPVYPVLPGTGLLPGAIDDCAPHKYDVFWRGFCMCENMKEQAMLDRFRYPDYVRHQRYVASQRAAAYCGPVVGGCATGGRQRLYLDYIRHQPRVLPHSTAGYHGCVLHGTAGGRHPVRCARCGGVHVQIPGDGQTAAPSERGVPTHATEGEPGDDTDVLILDRPEVGRPILRSHLRRPSPAEEITSEADDGDDGRGVDRQGDNGSSREEPTNDDESGGIVPQPGFDASLPYEEQRSPLWLDEPMPDMSDEIPPVPADLDGTRSTDRALQSNGEQGSAADPDALPRDGGDPSTASGRNGEAPSERWPSVLTVPKPAPPKATRDPDDAPARPPRNTIPKRRSSKMMSPDSQSYATIRRMFQ